jgi:tetratricopeptide (TPR) repeat protein
MIRFAAILVCLLNALDLFSAEDKPQVTWTGQLVMLKADEVTLYRDEPTGPVESEPLNPNWIYKVQKDQNQRLFVSFANKDGFISKSQAVLLKDAPAFFTELIKKEPQQARFYGRRGLAYFYQGHTSFDLSPNEQLRGDVQKAVADLDEAVKLDPNSITWWHRRGMIHNYHKDFDRAIADFQEVVKRQPEWSGAYSALATVWYSKKDYAQALTNFRRAADVEPANPAILANIGSSQYYLKQYDAAIADFTKALEVNPEYAGIHAFRGDVYFKKRNYEQALQDLNKAVEIDSHYAHAYVLRAKILRATGKYLLAEKDLNKALELDKNNSWAELGLALVYIKQQRYPLVVDHFERGAKLNPENEDLFKEYALFRASCPIAQFRDGVVAVRLGFQAMTLAGPSADWENHAALAAAYAETKDWDKAVGEQQCALQDKSLDALDRLEMQVRLALYQKKQPYRMND